MPPSPPIRTPLRTPLRTLLRTLLHRCRQELAGPAILLAAALAILAPQTLGGRSIVPFDALRGDPVFKEALRAAGVEGTQNGLVADLVFQNLVWKRFGGDEFRAGRPPLWNPYLAGGLPFLAAGQHGLLYPPAYPLLRLLPPERALGWLAALNLWLAGLGLYVLGRALRLGRLAATLMGLGATLSPLMVVNAVFPMIQATLCWIPWLIAALYRLTEAGPASAWEGGSRPRPAAMAWLLLLAAALTLMALAGHPEAYLQGLLVAAAFALWRLAAVARARGPRAALVGAAWLVSAGAVGVLGGLVQLVPLLELARTSFRRGAASYEDVVSWAFGVRQVFTFLVPDFYGNPAHHAVRLLEGGRVALKDHAMWGGAWGARNYVEAAVYPGLVVYLLAPLAFLDRRRRGPALFFGLLLLAALSFCFGLPSYRLLYHLMPGFDQLRTPFRWVFAVDLALLVLAGLGLQALVDRGAGAAAAGEGGRAATASRIAGRWGWAWGLAGAGGLVLLSLARLQPGAWNQAVTRFMGILGCPGGHCPLDAALDSFGSLEAFAAYQHGNLSHLATFLALGGLSLVLLLGSGAGRTGAGGEAAASAPDGLRRADRSSRLRPVLVRGTLLLVLALDLGLVGFGFNPANDPRLADLEPQLIRELRAMSAAKWGRVTAFGEDKLLWPNSAMRHGLSDLRAYDSILPYWTTESLSQVEDQSPWLIYNRLGNLQTAAGLSHPLLSALGLRYVVSNQALAHPQLKELYREEGGDLRIYERADALPRAWVVDRATVFPERSELLEALDRLDPAAEVYLEEEPDRSIWRDLPAGRPLRSSTRLRRDRELPDRLEIEVEGAPAGGFLVLGDAWFPGWKATVEVAGPEGRQEVAVPVYRADGMLRAVPVPPGLSTVRLVYRPTALKAGLFGSFLGLILFVLGLAYALAFRFLQREEADEVRRAARNSALPFLANLLGKLIQFGFAMLMLRLISPAEAGRYTVAVTWIGLTDILANFGLSVWATREAAQKPAEAGRILGQSLVLRLLLWLLAVSVLAGIMGWQDDLAPDGRQALLLLALGLLPSQMSAALSSLFQARERLVLPALVGLATTLINVALGAAFLLAGGGIAGVALASLCSNLATLGIFLVLALRADLRPRWQGALAGLGLVLAACWPLMVNSLLQTLFFKMDVLLLKELLPRDGDTVIGWYQAAYKWVDALLILSPAIVMALFPLLSRRAAEADRGGLARAYSGTLRWLLLLALPLSLATSSLAEPLVGLLAGAEYLPEGANALKLMVWFLPLSFANGLAQYVLIALGRQRLITVSFLLAATFNLLANWLLIPGHVWGGVSIPAYSYVGAAVVTILSEAVLWQPFSRGLRDLDVPPLLVLLWRPAIGTALAALAILGLRGLGLPALPATLLGLAVYALALLRLGAFGAEDRALLRRLLGRPDGAAEAA